MPYRAIRRKALWLVIGVIATAIGSTTTRAQTGGSGRIPNPVDVVGEDIFIWVVLGAAVGFVLNARDPHYVGVKTLLEKYGLTRVSLWLVIPLDVVFFVVLGPIIVTAAYMPQGLFQGITLGLGWPLVIRGAVRQVQLSESRDGSDGPHGGADTRNS